MSTSSSTSGSFVNQDNLILVISQLAARSSGKVPNVVLNRGILTSPSRFVLLEQEIKPFEKRAVLYRQNIISSNITLIFLQTLKGEKGSSLTIELSTKVLKAKDQLLQMIHKFSNIDPQLTCLKILAFRLAANGYQLSKNQDFCLIEKQSVFSTDSNPSRQVVVEKGGDLLKKEIGLLIFEIHQLEFKIFQNNQDFSGCFKEIESHKREIEQFLLAASDVCKKNRKINEIIEQIKNDLELVSNLQLAPQTLLPLAVSALGTDPLRFFSLASQQLRGLLKGRFEFACEQIEVRCVKSVKEIKQKGAQAKKCQAAIKKFHRLFKEKYRPLWISIDQSYGSTYEKIYTKSSVSPADHFKNCEQLLAQLQARDSLKMLEEIFLELKLVLKEALSLPLFEAIVVVLIDYDLLPIHNAFKRFHDSAMNALGDDLKMFSQAHQQYTKLIAQEQREMKAGCYTPIDLIYFSLLESIEAVYQLSDQSSVNKSLSFTGLKSHQMVVKARQFYQLGFPDLGEENNAFGKLYDESMRALQNAQQNLEPSTVSIQISSSIQKIESLLNCLGLLTISPAAYPFFLNLLGTQGLQPQSYEHPFSAVVINYIYGLLKAWRDSEVEIKIFKKEEVQQFFDFGAENGFESADVALSFEQPVTKGGLTLIQLEKADEAYFQKNVGLDWKKRWVYSLFAIYWEDIPLATPKNLPQVCLQLDRFMNRLKSKIKNLSMVKFIEGQDATEVDGLLETLDRFVILPYQSLKRYLVQSSLDDQSPLLKKRPQTTADQSHLLALTTSTSENLSENRALTSLQALYSSAEQVGHSLALLNHDDPLTFSQMRDFHAQIVYHLGSIEDLISKDVRKLNIFQFQTLLTHQASAIEQSVKLAALARYRQGKPSEALTQLIRASHQPSEFFTNFLPMPLNSDPAEWKKTVETASAVDGFLAGPARYGVITHPWMALLSDLEESGFDPIRIEVMVNVVQDNMSAFQALLSDVNRSLPAPGQSFVSSASSVGCLEGLKDQNLLQPPSPPAFVPDGSDQLSISLDTLSKITHVKRLSSDESIADLIKRREEIHANLYIVELNLDQVKVLLQEMNTSSWCSSYSSTVLLRAAAILEKSVQTLLFWLPVASPSNAQVHRLLSVRTGPGGSTIPLKYTHSIQENALVCATFLAGIGEAEMAQSLQSLGESLSWLDPFIQQLYRYPFSPIQNRSANLLRLFNALAEVRRSLHQGNQTVKEVVQKELRATSQDVNSAYDQLIQAHLNTHVIRPVYEILQASQKILAMLVKLSEL